MHSTTITAIRYSPAPSRMPMVSAQNIYAVSSGSLTAVRKRTMLSAPTMPIESAMSFLMHITTGVVIRVSMISVSVNDGL